MWAKRKRGEKEKSKVKLLSTEQKPALISTIL